MKFAAHLINVLSKNTYCRRVSARGLQELLGELMPSRPGDLTGCVFQQPVIRAPANGDLGGRGLRSGGVAGFTLAEVLAALLFMAIVIPVAVQGLQIANRAGEVAQRKSQAARIAERVLVENIATTNWNQSSQGGTIYEGTREFQWTMRNEPWNQNLTNQVPAETTSMGQITAGQPAVTATASSQTTLNLLSVEVTYTVQNRPYTMRVSTLINSLQ